MLSVCYVSFVYVCMSAVCLTLSMFVQMLRAETSSDLDDEDASDMESDESAGVCFSFVPVLVCLAYRVLAVVWKMTLLLILLSPIILPR